MAISIAKRQTLHLLESFFFGVDDPRYTQIVLRCPDFNNRTYYTRDDNVAVAYKEIHCHQLRNGFLTQNDTNNNITAAVVLSGSADAPLESAARNWMQTNAPLKPIATLILLIAAAVVTVAVLFVWALANRYKRWKGQDRGTYKED